MSCEALVGSRREKNSRQSTYVLSKVADDLVRFKDMEAFPCALWAAKFDCNKGVLHLRSQELYRTAPDRDIFLAPTENVPVPNYRSEASTIATWRRFPIKLDRMYLVFYSSPSTILTLTS